MRTKNGWQRADIEADPWLLEPSTDSRRQPQPTSSDSPRNSVPKRVSSPVAQDPELLRHLLLVHSSGLDRRVRDDPSAIVRVDDVPRHSS